MGQRQPSCVAHRFPEAATIDIFSSRRGALLVATAGMRTAALAYVVVVVGLGCLATLRTVLLLRRAHRARRGRLDGRDTFEPTLTDSPVADPLTTARERGARSIGNLSSVHQYVVVPAILAATAVLAIIPFVGHIPAAALSVLGAATAVLIGIAARPAVENAIAGLVIAYSRIMNIGDTLRIDDLYGTVEDISATHTTIKLWDWRRYVVPNARMLQSTFLNYSLFDAYMWVHVELHVAYEADLHRVRELAVESARKSSCYRDYEEPRFWIMELQPEAVRCWIAAWADNPAQAWQLAHDMRSELVLRLQEANIRTHGHRHWVTQAVGTPPPQTVVERHDSASASTARSTGT
jgi:small-conductance mechanosensitive channel